MKLKRLIRQFTFSILFISSLLFIFNTGIAQNQGGSYPYPYDYSCCVNQNCADPWSFIKLQCTSYVGWKLNQAFDNNPESSPHAFYNSITGAGGGNLSCNDNFARLSNACRWAMRLGDIGYMVDDTPTPGSIAQWNAYEGGTEFAGHVAYVESVNTDGSAHISEYNFGTTCGYTVRDVFAPRYIRFNRFKLEGDIIVNPNPIVQNQSVTVSLDINNNSNFDVTTNIRCALYSSNNVFLGEIDLEENVYFASNQTRSLTFSKDVIYTDPGNYKIWIETRVSDQTPWTLLHKVGGSSTKSIIIVSGTSIELQSSLGSITPNPMVQGGPVDLILQVQNTGDLPWTGCVILELHGGGSYIGDIGNTGSTTISAGQIKILNLTKPEITSSPGDYQLQLKYQTACSGAKTLIDPGAYINPYPIQIVAGATPNIIYNDHIVYDGNGAGIGNANGQAQPGEEIDLSVELFNNGSGDAHDVSATLSTTDPDITITDVSQNWGTISAGTTDWTSYFDFEVSGNCPSKDVTFHLTITADEGYWTDQFVVHIYENSGAPDLSYLDHIIDDDASGGSNGDGDGFTEPGESIELLIQLINNGTITANNVSATLTTNDPDITIDDDYESFGDIMAGANNWCISDYDFDVSANCPDKDVLFTLDISSDEDVWTEQFTVHIYGPTNLPDLVVQAQSVNPSSTTAGSSVTLNCDVVNDGTGSAGSSRIGYYLSENTTYESSQDQFLNDGYVPSLMPGHSSPEIITVAIPPEISPDSYYILFFADHEESVNESDESNNVEAVPITIEEPLPDLVVTGESLSQTNIQAGSSVIASCYVENQGDASAGSSILLYCLSQNTTFESLEVDPDVGSNLTTTLIAGGSDFDSRNITIPEETPEGPWYILFFADGYENWVSESNENNNVNYIPITVTAPPPDLIVQYPNVNPTTVEAGSAITVNCNVLNNGAGPAGESYLGYYLSVDQDYDAADVYLNVDYVQALIAGLSSSETKTFIIPSGTTAGDYFILFYADHLETVPEGDEGNNVEAVPITVTEPLPDLIVSSSGANPTTIEAGSSTILNCTVLNNGSGSAGESYVGYFLSEDIIYDASDIYLDEDFVYALNPGGAIGETESVVIPLNTTAGQYYILFYADYLENIPESSEGNNWAYLQITVNELIPYIFETQKLLAMDGASEDRFGKSVSISGNYAIVGAYWDDDIGSNSGSAYVYYNNSGTWLQQAKLTASDAAADDYFGYSVCISEGVAVIGAYRDDDNGFASGSSYIFSNNSGTWLQEAKLTASDGASYDYFGRCVGISENYVIVGANGDDDNGSESGSVYIFSNTAGSWLQQTKLTASDGSSEDLFGSKVNISGDLAIVGAYRDDDNGLESGSAYIFSHNSGTWQQQVKLIASDGDANDYFGWSVDISESYAVIGAEDDDGFGSAYIYSVNSGSWDQETKITAPDNFNNLHFGRVVSIFDNNVVVGGLKNTGTGLVEMCYFFSNISDTWLLQKRFMASDGTNGNGFGTSLCIFGDYTIVGARSNSNGGVASGSAYIFGPPQSSLELTVALEGAFVGTGMASNLNDIPLAQPYDNGVWSYQGLESVSSIPNGNVVDWVMVELRETTGDASTTLPDSMILRRAAFLLEDGSVVDLDGVSPLRFDNIITGNLFAAVYHRNHLAVMSSAPLQNSNDIYSWDFTAGYSQAYGGNDALKYLGNGIYGMYGGDCFGFGVIDLDDKFAGWVTAAGNSGYLRADLNLDGEVDNNDKNNFLLDNLNKAIQLPGNNSDCQPIFDTRDGKIYNTVQIGTQCWMAENLNIGTLVNGTENMIDNNTIEKYCYDNNPANCQTYGGLYQWDEMMQYVSTEGTQGICPDGWHIPTEDEWTTIIDFLGGPWAAGGKMKEDGYEHWMEPNSGATNSSEFSGLPGGYLDIFPGMWRNFTDLTGSAQIWSSNETVCLQLWHNVSIAQIGNQDTPDALSVRCIKDE